MCCTTMTRLLRSALVVAAVIFWVDVKANTYTTYFCHFGKTLGRYGNYPACFKEVMNKYRPQLVAQTEPLKIYDMEAQRYKQVNGTFQNAHNATVSNIIVRNASKIKCDSISYRKTSDFKLTDPNGTEAVEIAIGCSWPPESFEVTMDFEYYSKPGPDLNVSATARITFTSIRFTTTSRWKLTKAVPPLKLRQSQPKGEISKRSMNTELKIHAKKPDEWKEDMTELAQTAWDKDIKKKLLEETDGWYQEVVFPGFAKEVTGSPFA